MNTPDLFTIAPIHRQVASWERVTRQTIDRQLEAVLTALRSNLDGLTSRELSELTGIERTSITRTLSNNADRFDATNEKYDQKTNRTVTLYKEKTND